MMIVIVTYYPGSHDYNLKDKVHMGRGREKVEEGDYFYECQNKEASC